MKKLSELSNDTRICVSYVNYDGDVMNKEDFFESDYWKFRSQNKPKVYIADLEYATFSFDNAFECLADEMYEDWQDDVERDFRGTDINLAEIEDKINEILHRHPSYSEGEAVDIDN